MDQQEQNPKKDLLFKISIIIVVVAVFFLWLANLKNVFEDNSERGDKTWQKISTDIDASLDRLDKAISDLATTTATTTTSSVPVVSTTTIIKTELKEELSDLIKKATTTKSGCPEYINCMPSIGESRPCVIPLGCEDITQIAY